MDMHTNETADPRYFDLGMSITELEVQRESGVLNMLTQLPRY